MAILMQQDTLVCEIDGGHEGGKYFFCIVLERDGSDGWTLKSREER